MNDSTALKIVTFTSWKKRLGNIPTVLDSIFKQTIKPDKVVLNLSVEEFPKKEEDLPSDVLKYLKEHDVEIYWVEGKNTKQWKKIIPTLFRYPNDWIICIDDDRIYDKKFIEKLWTKHLKCPNEPITLNRGYKVKGYLQHCGHGTLECMNFYNRFEGIDVNEVAEKFSSSDTFYNYVLSKNKHHLIPIDEADGSRDFNPVEPLRKSQGTCTTAKHIEIWEWLCEKYGKPTENKVENVVDGKKAIETVYGEINKKQRRVVDLTATRRMRRI